MELVWENGQIRRRNLLDQRTKPSNQDGKKMDSFQDYCPKPFQYLSKTNQYCKVLEHNTSNSFNKIQTDHQAVPKQDDTELEHLSQHFFEDPSRLMMRSGEKSTWVNPEACKIVKSQQKSQKVAKEVEFTVPDEQSAAIGSSDVNGGSKDPKNDSSWESRYEDSEDSTYLSEDVEEESEGFPGEVPSQISSGSKRKRIAEVHNLCEKSRRDKINKKMRALQELIPDCNKADKASVLDKAIEYLKTLQLQIQMMTMATRFYMHSLASPMGIPQINPKPYFHSYSPMNMEMLMGQAYGSVHGFASSLLIPRTIPMMPISMVSSMQSPVNVPSTSDAFLQHQNIKPDMTSNRRTECSKCHNTVSGGK